MIFLDILFKVGYTRLFYYLNYLGVLILQNFFVCSLFPKVDYFCICSVSSSSTAVFFFYKVFLALENGLISFRHVPVWDWFLCSFSQCKWELLNWTWHESVFFIFHPNILGIETLFCVLCHFSDAEKQTFLDPFTLGIKLCEYQL